MIGTRPLMSVYPVNVLCLRWQIFHAEQLTAAYAVSDWSSRPWRRWELLLFIH